VNVKRKQSVKELQNIVRKIDILRNLPLDSQQSQEWRRNTSVTIERIFANDGGKHKKEFESFYFSVVVAGANSVNARNQAYLKYLDSVESCLKSMIEEIKKWGMPTHKAVKSTEEEVDGTITPKPPEILGKILWVLRYGRKWWWLLLLAMMVLILPLLLKFTYNKEDKSNRVQNKTSGNLSPAITTQGPNSSVTNIYNFSGEEKNLKQSNENKLQVTLRAICDDIDSRPLAQQDETAKKYVDMKMKIKRDRLRVHRVEVNQGDSSIYDLEFIFPDEPDSPSIKWMILCTVSKNIYPQLSFARKGNNVYVSGEVQATFRRPMDLYKCVVLSNIKLEFE